MKVSHLMFREVVCVVRTRENKTVSSGRNAMLLSVRWYGLILAYGWAEIVEDLMYGHRVYTVRGITWLHENYQAVCVFFQTERPWESARTSFGILGPLVSNLCHTLNPYVGLSSESKISLRRYLQHITNKCTTCLILNCICKLLHVSMPQCIIMKRDSQMMMHWGIETRRSFPIN